MANMTDISITDFQLPGDDPAGGISLSVQTKLTNPRFVFLSSPSIFRFEADSFPLLQCIRC